MLHIITPFSRLENKKFYIDNFRDKDIIWHPIVCMGHPKEADTIPTWRDISKDEIKEFYEESFIQPHLTETMLSKVDISYYKADQFIKNFLIIDDDWYGFMCDDDWISNETIEFFKQDIHEYAVFVSLKRGDVRPNNKGHGISTLIAKPEEIKVGHIGWQQVYIKGKVLKEIRLEYNVDYADGLMAKQINRHYKIRFEPEIFNFFNYLEKGRYLNVE